MHVRYAILCDYSNDTTDGKLNLFGTTDVIYAFSFPCIHKVCHFVVSFEVDPDDFGVTRTVVTELIDADGQGLVKFEAPILIPENQRLINHRHIIHDLNFPKEGTYQFTVRIDGMPSYTYPFVTMQVTQPV